MYEQLIIAGFTAFGALAYNAWGFWKAWEETISTPAREVWDWRLTVTTVIPSLVAGFVGGYQLTPSNPADYVSLVITGFGIASAQGKLGVKNFFRKE